MKAMAFFCAMLGVMALFALSGNDKTPEVNRANAVAVNFAKYRNAVNLFAVNNLAFTGSVPTASLDLRDNWQPIRPWNNRIAGGRCYVWGEMDFHEYGELKNILTGSAGIGFKRNGIFVNEFGSSLVLPAFIPEESAVSVITQE